MFDLNFKKMYGVSTQTSIFHKEKDHGIIFFLKFTLTTRGNILFYPFSLEKYMIHAAF